MKRIIVCCIVGSLAFAGLSSHADDELEKFKNEALLNLKNFRDKAYADRDAFRDKVLSDLKEWAANPWKSGLRNKGENRPIDEDEIPPVVIPYGKPAPHPDNAPVRDNPVVAPKPVAPPTPPKPVIPPAPPVDTPANFLFTSYGTKYTVDAPKDIIRKVTLTNPALYVANYINSMDMSRIDRLVSSIQTEAKKHNLSDWAFYKMTEHFTKSYIPNDINQQKMLQGLILITAGYDVRFGGADNSDRIYLLVGISDCIIGTDYITFNNKNRYSAFEKLPNGIKCTDSYGDNKLLSVRPTGKELFDYRRAASHRAVICIHEPHCRNNNCNSPLLELNMSGNLNRMEFFSEVPQCFTSGNQMSQWNAYANTKLSQDIESQVYPSLRRVIAGKDKLQAANILMKFVEAFPYGLDSEIWCEDRPFFPEETLHYPKRDCEDGAILLTRLVRDLLGLPTALVYYPGHLAAAIAFDTDVRGAYIMYGSKKYTVCDPTYYYVNVGVQMPPDKVDYSKAVLIPVN